MLRKRSGTVSKEQAKNSPMADSVSSLSSDSTVHRTRSSSFFSIPGLFVGFNRKGLSDYCDSAKSPTSPLDFKSFSNPLLVKSPRSPKSWDYNRVGLGIVDSLSDESNKSSGTVLMGSPLRLTSTKSLPKDYGFLSGRSPNYNLDRSEISIRNRGHEFGKIRSCSTDLGGNFKPDLGNFNFKSDSNEKLLARSLPVSIINSLSASEIEKSEDYTCIISYGPNAKTTHIFGDFILESRSANTPDNCENKELKEGLASPKLGFGAPTGSSPTPSNDFLSFCFSCKKKLEGKDIYIYRGEKAFCSCNCRDQQILIEEGREREEEREKLSYSEEEIFMDGMFVST